MARKGGGGVSKELAGIIGALLGLAILGLVGVQFNKNFVRSRRAIAAEESSQNDYDYDMEMDDDEAGDLEWDEWTNPNNTDMWSDFVRSVGGELSDDDVSPKQRRINWNRLRENQLERLHENMLAEFATHYDALSFYNEISGVDYGRRDPSEFGEEMNDEGDYSGFHRTAPVVQKFVDALDCKANGKGNFGSGGSLNFWFLMPAGVPLFSSAGKHMSDYNYFWNFFMKFANSWPGARGNNIRFSIGSYGNGANFAPRGYKFRNNVPWSRMQRLYRKPKMQATRPKIFSALRSLLTYLPRYGVSTASAGDDCVLIWLFQDVPRDLNDFMVPEEFEMVTEINSMCTIIPVIIAPQAGSDEKTHEAWRKFTANLLPGTRTMLAKDPDFAGAFFVDSHKDLENAALVEHVHKYLCLVKNRATCRIVGDGWLPPASEGVGTDGPTDAFRGIEDDYEADVTDFPETPGMTETPGTTVEATTAKVPEIDSCCGHNAYASVPFDSELKTCCENGKVMAYEFEGDDPCLAADEFAFRK